MNSTILILSIYLLWYADFDSSEFHKLVILTALTPLMYER